MSKDHGDGLKAAVAALTALKSKPLRKTKKANGDIEIALFGQTNEHLAQVAVEAYLNARGLKP